MTKKEKERQKMLLNKIKEVRKAKGYSQSFVAEKLSIDQRQYSLFENGKTQVPLERFLIISEILDLDFDLMPNEQAQKRKYFSEFLEQIKNILPTENPNIQTT